MRPLKISEKERKRRKRYLTATLVTCITLAMVGGSLHVMKLGSLRMDEMRGKASYDITDSKKHIRAAGEEVYLQAENEKDGAKGSTYTPGEAQSLLSEEQWRDVSWMILIPAGVFTMGSDDPRTSEQNRPAHKVRTGAYKIDKFPVTQAQYARFVAARHYRPPLNWHDGHIPRGYALHPVTMVSWYNARDYCAWAGKRLPTEAEWEKAARGTDARPWPWGAVMHPDYLNTYYNVGHTTEVNAYPNGASPYGVMDMAGNVQEWVADEFKPYPGTQAKDEVFQAKAIDQSYNAGSEEKERLIYFVMRGGSWKSDPFSSYTYHRNYSMPNYASDFFGFRCAMDAPHKEK
ncbi:MAG TPA: SUMF1/EgtB/PvdO family nonheme iron enzyme [Mariprofundaceae bacterium]|nr:SUMF1/EgtB/PvdO family nonheme iron enzyme [Mariprofundaceae bacterium]